MESISEEVVFDKIGRLLMATEAMQRRLNEVNELLSKTERTAGEALKALEEFGHTATATAITEGKPWREDKDKEEGPMVEGEA